MKIVLIFFSMVQYLYISFFSDVDECASPTSSKCSQMCHNTPGSYRCMCMHGYHLDDDNKTCLCEYTPLLLRANNLIKALMTRRNQHPNQ